VQAAEGRALVSLKHVAIRLTDEQKARIDSDPELVDILTGWVCKRFKIAERDSEERDVVVVVLLKILRNAATRWRPDGGQSWRSYVTSAVRKWALRATQTRLKQLESVRSKRPVLVTEGEGGELDRQAPAERKLHRRASGRPMPERGDFFLTAKDAVAALPESNRTALEAWVRGENLDQKARDDGLPVYTYHKRRIRAMKMLIGESVQ
jgi:DNA-directed RNA polymerase specialized sigma24 family protein